jgi:AraC family transcriptional regulator of arabinose operon
MEGIQKDFRIQEAARLLNENSSFTLSELARRYHLSISRLSHLFKTETGFTVQNYRGHCRFRAAARMLETTDLSIKQVAYAVGYHHTSSFVRAFILHSGVSPNNYRRRQSRSPTDLMISR